MPFHVNVHHGRVTAYLIARLGRDVSLPFLRRFGAELVDHGDMFFVVNPRVSPDCIQVVLTIQDAHGHERTFRFVVSDRWAASHGVYQVVFVDEE